MHWGFSFSFIQEKTLLSERVEMSRFKPITNSGVGQNSTSGDFGC